MDNGVWFEILACQDQFCPKHSKKAGVTTDGTSKRRAIILNTLLVVDAREIFDT